MSPQEEVVARGRKVFFLYPHSVLNEELLIEILSNEYEIYSIRNHDAAVKVAAAYPGSIFFVNIDDTLKEYQWEAWIRRLISQPETSSTMVGIVTYNPDAELARKYLMDMMLPCGFIQLKLGLAEGKKIILKTLEANEARGRRRYVRAQIADPKKASFNVKVQERIYAGTILDISAAGMTFDLDTPIILKPQTPLADLQLRLKGTLCRVGGTFVGAARGGAGRNLLMFESPLEEETRKKIHRFIFQSLQDEMDAFIRTNAS
jgi:hypothetical protein